MRRLVLQRSILIALYDLADPHLRLLLPATRNRLEDDDLPPERLLPGAFTVLEFAMFSATTRSRVPWAESADVATLIRSVNFIAYAPSFEPLIMSRSS